MVKLTFDRAKKTLVSAAVIPVCLSASAMPVHADTAPESNTPTPIVKTQSGENNAGEAMAASEKEEANESTGMQTQGNTQESTTCNAAENTGQTTQTAQTVQESKTTGDKILGEARNYGIVCDNYTQTYDAETNIAAKEAKTNPGQHTGNDLTARKEQTYLIGKVDGNFGIKGNQATVVTPDANGAGLYDGTYTIDSSKTKEEIEEKIKQLKQSALHRLDAALMNAHEARVGRAENDNQKWCLDLSGKDPGTYKVSIKDKDVFSEAGKLDIKINADTQAVILSVDDSLISENGILDFASYNINEQGCASYNTGKFDGDKSAKAIIWDFRNSKLKTINIGTSSGNWINGSSNGIFIAPNADINLNSTSSGWIICKDMHVEYGEWHNIDQSETLAPEDNPTTPGEEEKSEDKPNTPKPNAGESGKPSDSGKTDTPSVENPSGHNENENAGGSSTEIKNTDKPSETGNDKPEEEKPSGDNKKEAPKTDHTDTTGKETKPEDNEKKNEHKQNVIEESNKTNPSSEATTDSNGGTEGNGSTVSNTSEKSQTNNSTSKGEETSKSSTHKKDSKNTGKGKNSDVNKEKVSKNEINNKNANPREQAHNSHNNVGENVNVTYKAHGSVTSTVAEGGKEAGYNALAKEGTENVAAASDSEVSSAETVPKTGDHSNLLLYGGLFAASAAALALALLKAKKSK
jgi:hypothetical protein